MKAYCGADCENCGYGKEHACGGCRTTDGCPFGAPCFIAAYIRAGGKQAYDVFVDGVKEEIRRLDVPGLPPVRELYPVNGAYVNLAYPMPSGECVKLLRDNDIYLAAQLESEFSDDETARCFGIVANTDMILVAEYGENGAEPVLLRFHKR